jgi:hypothetical protein
MICLGLDGPDRPNLPAGPPTVQPADRTGPRTAAVRNVLRGCGTVRPLVRRGARRRGPLRREGMDLLSVVLVLVVVGVLLWLINTYVPMQPTIKSILNAVVIIVVVLWLLRAFGLLDALPTFRTRG